MNNELQEFARDQLLTGLEQLPDDWQMMFKRMYSHNNLEASIDSIVESMPEDKLDHAMSQVQASLNKIAGV